MQFDLPNVKTVVDLRGHKFEPSSCAPDTAEVININFIETSTGIAILKGLPLGKTLPALVSKERDAILARATFSDIGMTRLYALMLDQCEDKIRDTLRIFTHRSNFPIDVHCVHGKDRTGIVIALLLLLCNVDPGKCIHTTAVFEPRRRCSLPNCTLVRPR